MRATATGTARVGGRAISRVLFWATAALATGCRPPTPSTEVIHLTEGWEFRWAGEATGPGVPGDLLDTLSTWLPATAPGTVHTDLLAQGLIPDPFFRNGELRVQWVGEEDWLYRTSFTVGSKFLEKEVLQLILHGLDTFAQVRLNGNTVLEADNMFRSWAVDVKEALRTGQNTLEILFRSPIQPALDARAALPYELPAGNDRGDPPSRVFVRKAAYHYGWDWGPRLVTSGIWQPIDLVGWSGGRVSDLHLTTDSITDGVGFVRASVEVLIAQEEAERRKAGGNVPVVITFSSPEGAFEAQSRELPVEPGPNRVEFSVQIPEPRLWWPNGVGEPHLYTVQAALKAGHMVDTLRTRFGLRTLELVTEPDSIGESFFFQVNGVPVFMKGANVIPLDHFSPRVKEEDYLALFQDVVWANMNMLRVWGGGIYENDIFYDLADEHGILVWQDFMFANGMYPGDSTFLESVEAEVSHQVRRLRNHPSLALWCGNNEMDEGWKNWGWARNYDTPEDSAAVRRAYEALFHQLLPDIVAELDPGRRYWPSSPSLGWGDPESLNRGDSHYWGIWHGQEDFQVFAEKIPRFSSEYGFQAFPPMETVEAFTWPEDRELFHPTMLVHQKHPIGNELILDYMARDFPVPEAFDDLVYVSQLLQARGMRTAFEAHRRAMPRTMGTLYWQLNDTWPAVSWSSRDFFGRLKALHYIARKSFAPTLVSTTQKGDTLEVWGIRDPGEPLEGTLLLELLDFDGPVLWEDSVPVSLGENQSRLLWSGSASLLEGTDSRRSVLSARFLPSLGSGAVSSALLYFHPPKELELRTPTIRMDLVATEDGADLILETDVLAKDVYLRLEEGRFSDNFFDLVPGRTHRVSVQTEKSLEEIRAELIIRTLAEVPKDGTPVEETL